MPQIPQAIVTLSPSGQLQAEIPGPNGSRSVIPLPPDQCYAALSRILRGQALDAANEAWAVMQAHRSHKSYEDQLDDLSDRKYKAMAARRAYTLVESQIGLLPQVKTTKSGRSHTHTQSKPNGKYNSPAVKQAFSDL